jgi:hypothetical protein
LFFNILFFIMASQANVQIVKKLGYLNLNLMNTNANIYFNQTCKRLKLIPNYINVQIKSKTVAAIKAKCQAEKIWLNSEIKFLYSKRQLIYDQISKIESILSSSYTHSQLTLLKNDIMHNLQSAKNDKFNKINNKIDNLKNKLQSNFPHTHTFQPRITNLTNISINKNEINLLNKGNKFNLFKPLSFKDVKVELIQCESVIDFAQFNNQNHTRHNLIDNTNKHFINNKNKILKYNSLAIKQSKIINSISNKLRANNAIIVPADKSNAIVLAYKVDIHDKTSEFIKNNNIKLLSYNPTDIYYKQIN